MKNELRSSRFISSPEYDVDALLTIQNSFILFVMIKKNSENILEDIQKKFDWGPVEVIAGAVKNSQSSKPFEPTYFREKKAEYVVLHQGLKFKCEVENVLNPGIFLDQEENRKKLSELLPFETGKKCLNLFSYTGAFSVHARSMGLTTTSVDLSKRYLEWEKKNMNLNGFQTGFRLIQEDARKFIKKANTKKDHYDLIIIDPPTFSRTPGNVFKVQDELFVLGELALDILNPNGLLFLSTNHAAWDERDFLRRTKEFADRNALKTRIGELPKEFMRRLPKYSLKSVLFRKKN